MINKYKEHADLTEEQCQNKSGIVKQHAIFSIGLFLFVFLTVFVSPSFLAFKYSGMERGEMFIFLGLLVFAGLFLSIIIWLNMLIKYENIDKSDAKRIIEICEKNSIADEYRKNVVSHRRLRKFDLDIIFNFPEDNNGFEMCKKLHEA